MQKQVIICDQQNIYALGSGALLKDNGICDDYCVVQNLDELHTYTQNESAKLIIVDSALLQFNEPDIQYKINELKKSSSIMVVFNEEDDLHLYQIIDSGISVIVSRNVSKDEWLKGTEMASQDKIFFCTKIAHRVFDLVNQMEKIKLIEKVQNLELYDKYILVRICEEASSKQIAYEVGYSKRTIEGHRTKLMQLFEVKNVAGLVKIAFVTKLYDDYLSNPGLYDVTLCAKTSAL